MHDLPGGGKVFAGQRADAFHVDLGSVFDLGALRPFNSAHLISMPDMSGVNAVQAFNVHTIAIQVPIQDLTKDGSARPARPPASRHRGLGDRQPAEVAGLGLRAGKYVGHGPWKQVSRLGNPLFNEVLVPMAEKDQWNARPPRKDARYAKYVDQPELAGLLPVLYPGVFPNLAAYASRGRT